MGYGISDRMKNAWEEFIEVIMSQGFSRADAVKAANTMLDLKVAKMDAVNGTIRVTHGAYLDRDAIQAAVDYKPRMKGKKNPGKTEWIPAHAVRIRRVGKQTLVDILK